MDPKWIFFKVTSFITLFFWVFLFFTFIANTVSVMKNRVNAEWSTEPRIEIVWIENQNYITRSDIREKVYAIYRIHKKDGDNSTQKYHFETKLDKWLIWKHSESLWYSNIDSSEPLNICKTPWTKVTFSRTFENEEDEEAFKKFWEINYIAQEEYWNNFSIDLEVDASHNYCDVILEFYWITKWEKTVFPISWAIQESDNTVLSTSNSRNFKVVARMYQVFYFDADTYEIIDDENLEQGLDEDELEKPREIENYVFVEGHKIKWEGDMYELFYRRKVWNIEINYLDKNTNEKIDDSKEISLKYWEDYDYSELKKDEINDYLYDSWAEALKWKVKEDNKKINLYYTKAVKDWTVIIDYIDKETNQKLDSTTVKWKVWDNFTIEQKEFKNYRFDSKDLWTLETEVIKDWENTVKLYYVKKDWKVIISYKDENWAEIQPKEVFNYKYWENYDLNNKKKEIKYYDFSNVEWVLSWIVDFDERNISLNYKRKQWIISIYFKDAQTNQNIVQKVEKTSKLWGEYNYSNYLETKIEGYDLKKHEWQFSWILENNLDLVLYFSKKAAPIISWGPTKPFVPNDPRVKIPNDPVINTPVEPKTWDPELKEQDWKVILKFVNQKREKISDDFVKKWLVWNPYNVIYDIKTTIGDYKIEKILEEDISKVKWNFTKNDIIITIIYKKEENTNIIPPMPIDNNITEVPKFPSTEVEIVPPTVDKIVPPTIDIPGVTPKEPEIKEIRLPKTWVDFDDLTIEEIAKNYLKSLPFVKIFTK